MRRRSRRHFLRSVGGLGLSAASLGFLSACGLLPPREAHLFQARPPPKAPTIGYLQIGSRELSGAYIEALLATLRDGGWVEGQNISIEWRWAETGDRLPELAAELVRLNVDLIASGGTPAAQAAKAATGTIPIVINSSDPVGAGLVASLARPGGNVTGVTNYFPELTSKKLQFLRDVVPGSSSIAFLTNPNNPTYRAQEVELENAAQALGVRLQRLEVRAPDQLESAFRAATDQRTDALVVLSDSLVLIPQRARIADLAAQHRLPSIFPDRRDVEAGGLLAYGVDPAGQARQVAAYVDRILRGAKPADLPVVGPTEFEFIINLKTANALGLAIPQSVLAQATKLIE